MDPAFRRILVETSETLAVALAGGVTFIWLGLPAGLVSGSVLAVATAACSAARCGFRSESRAFVT